MFTLSLTLNLINFNKVAIDYYIVGINFNKRDLMQIGKLTIDQSKIYKNSVCIKTPY